MTTDEFSQYEAFVSLPPEELIVANEVPCVELTFPLVAHGINESTDVLVPGDLSSYPEYGVDQQLPEGTVEAVLAELDERENQIIRLKFGIYDGVRHTDRQIADELGITKARVGQIARAVRIKCIQKLSLALQAERSMELDPEEGPHLASPHERRRLDQWLYRRRPGEPWYTPVKDIPEASLSIKRGTETYQRVYDAFASFVMMSPWEFLKAGTEARYRHSSHVVQEIEKHLGNRLTPEHIEDFWNNDLGRFIATLESRVAKNEIDYDRFSFMTSWLLAPRMHEDTALTFTLVDKPPLNFLGCKLKKGKLTLEGNAGNRVGMAIGGTFYLKVTGDVGDEAGFGAYGSAVLEVQGSAGRHFGARSSKTTKLSAQSIRPLNEGHGVASGGNQPPFGEPRIPGQLYLKEVAASLGVAARQLTEYYDAAGLDPTKTIGKSEIDALRILHPELAVPPLPEEGYVTLEAVNRLHFAGRVALVHLVKALRRRQIQMDMFRDAEGKLQTYVLKNDLDKLD